MAEVAVGGGEPGAGAGGLVGVFSRELAQADARWRAGDRPGAARGVARAGAVAFHRGAHFDRVTSPLADDPAGYTRVFRESRAVEAVGAPRGRGAVPPPRDPGRPVRLVLATAGNGNFVGPIRDRYAAHPDVEFRELDMKADPELGPMLLGQGRLAAAALGVDPEFTERAERLLRPWLDWADTIFLDWCTAGAALLTLVDPGSTRVILRLHRFEAYTLWPWLVDFSRVDDLVLISEPMRAFFGSLRPDVNSRVVLNALDLTRYAVPKDDSARFAVGMVGQGQIAKDPRWAVEVLSLLRAADTRYRLRIIGGRASAQTAAAALYLRDFREAAAATGAVDESGQTADVPGELAHVGVILSSSVCEGAPCGVAEGVASGAVPVVRDWPWYAAVGVGARAVYPEPWVVRTPEEAAARILDVTRDEDTWREAGRLAAEHAHATWDWSVVSQEFDRLLHLNPRPLGSPGPQEV